MITQFPAELSKEAVHQMVAFVTKQDTDVGRAGLAAWNILGYAGHLTLGTPTVAALAGSEKPLTTLEMVEKLTELDLSEGVPPWVIDLAISIVLRLVERFVKK